jgi:hypothetical protein
MMTRYTMTYKGQYDETERRAFSARDLDDAQRQAGAWLYTNKETWPEYAWELISVVDGDICRSCGKVAKLVETYETDPLCAKCASVWDNL